MTKDEILQLAKEKGVKLSFLNNLIGGYRGKLTDWKNGKTTLKDNEIKIITDYLLGKDENPNEKIVLDMNQKDMVVLPRETKKLSQEDYETLKKLLDGTVETFLKAKGKL